ncbi:MAG: SAM-dependent methyltransferase, partial [Corynebacterium casei]|nr:SAM-dependent methyltransferase [Corynebacterium casei]
MAYSSNEVDFLARNRAAIATSAESLELTKASTMADMDSLRKEYGEYSRAVAELTSARRAGVRTHKFPGLAESATEFLVDTGSIQQATPHSVAQFRAQELAALGINQVHDVTCSVGFEGAALTGAGISYIGSDIDRIRLSMARHNIPTGHFLAADALTHTTTSDVILADPARRAGVRTHKFPGLAESAT